MFLSYCKRRENRTSANGVGGQANRDNHGMLNNQAVLNNQDLLNNQAEPANRCDAMPISTDAEGNEDLSSPSLFNIITL